MGTSAVAEAKRAGWVWAHKIARALGGLDVPENLVAATTEANRIMLVFERMAIAMTKQGKRVDIRAEASLRAGSRVGHELRYWITAEVERKVKRLDNGQEVEEIVRGMEVILEGTLDLATREPVPTGANNAFNAKFGIR
jgi:hypothetical protein